MLLIKLILTLAYYGIIIYIFHKFAQSQQEYLDIMDEYKQEREQVFPNLTEQEQKNRKKTISKYYEQKNPSFALKRKFSFIIAIIALVFFVRAARYLFPFEDIFQNWDHVLVNMGIAFIITAAIGFYLYKSKRNEREIFQQYLMEHPKNELQVVLVTEKLQIRSMQNTNKRYRYFLILGILFTLHTIFSKYIF